MDVDQLQRMKLQFQIIGKSVDLDRAIDTAIQVAHTDLSVLIIGESGVGKENIPKIIHANSPRKSKKYIAVNCGAIPEGTIDSELFGHEKGAFTGAVNERDGYFAEANGGTIFLDEVAELPIATQARLLRVLENGEYIKVGSSKVEKTDVRIVAATNVNLVEAVEQGRFRSDLYYRLSTIPIRIPTLRERGKDILLLFRKFAMDCSKKYQMPLLELDNEASEAMMSYSWPGNVRQLKNITEQMSIMSPSRVVTLSVLRDFLPADRNSGNLPAITGRKDGGNASFENEREILYKVLFELRRDVTDLKAQMADMLQTSVENQQHVQKIVTQPETVTQPDAARVVQSSVGSHKFDDIQETEEYVEESFTLAQAEKIMIERALAKYNGRRKDAAAELNISERTLYRKIKEYNLDK